MCLALLLEISKVNLFSSNTYRVPFIYYVRVRVRLLRGFACSLWQNFQHAICSDICKHKLHGDFQIVAEPIDDRWVVFLNCLYVIIVIPTYY
jgi:hypothetical protein